MSAYQQFNQVLTDWDKLQHMRESLENYADALRGRTEVEGDAATLISITLESIDPDFDIKEGSKVTLRAIKEGIKSAARATADIIAYLWNTLKALYIKFTGSIRQVRRNQAGISKRLGALGSKTTYSKMSVAGVQRLSVNGEFVGAKADNLQDIKDTTNYILNMYPKSIIKISRDTSRQFLNIVEQNEGQDAKVVASMCMERMVDIMQSGFRPPPGHRPISPSELATQEKGINRGEILPGNVAFIFTPPTTIQQNLTGGSKDPLTDLERGFVMQFAELQLNVADKSEREIDVPSVQELKELTGVIANILTLAERGEDGIRDFTSVKTVVDDAIRQIAEKGSNDTSGDSHRPIDTVLHMLGVISKKLAEPMGHYLHWLAVTLNVYLTFIGHCIDHYENQGV